MKNKIAIEDAKVTQLSFDASVNFAQENKEQGVTGFELEGYTGAAVDRWWGKLVIDLSGISSKQQMPIFRDHNPSAIVGFSTKVLTDDIFRVSGTFSKETDAAREVAALASEGFPWQASIGVKPKVILELKEGAVMEVNGYELAGPAEIWTESEVYETSFVPLGADNNTSATVFSNIEEVQEHKRAIPPTNKEEPFMDLKDLREKQPELVAQLEAEFKADHSEELTAARDEGAEAERLRIKAVHDQAFPGHEALVADAMFDGKSQAGDVAIQINAANLAAQKEAGENLSGDAPAPVPEPVNNGEASKDNGPVTEDKLQAKWDKDEGLRAEFGGDFKSYLALEMPGDGVRFKTLSKSEEN